MKVEKLTLEHWTPYLPYGLNTNNGILHAICRDGLAKTKLNDGEIVKGRIENLRPLLRPLSQLTETITHNGETFVPIARLLGIERKINSNSILEWNGDYILHRWGTKPIEKEMLANTHNWKLSYKQFQMLASWHFDFMEESLLQANLALPIINP